MASFWKQQYLRIRLSAQNCSYYRNADIPIYFSLVFHSVFKNRFWKFSNCSILNPDCCKGNEKLPHNNPHTLQRKRHCRGFRAMSEYGCMRQKSWGTVMWHRMALERGCHCPPVLYGEGWQRSYATEAIYHMLPLPTIFHYRCF